jgi:branched-chain amino acid transport system ATP-binding protein
MNHLATSTLDPILSARDLGKTFVGLQALSNFSVDVYPNEIIGLIGPNGAGKTTCFNVLTGFLVPTQGSITFLGRDITGLPPAKVSRLGLARTFQNIRVFGSLTVLDNVLTAAQMHVDISLWETLISASSFHRKEQDIRARAVSLLELLDLADQAQLPAASLPYGHQRRLEIARALATQPKILLLDEPAAGMNPTESDALHRLILDLRARFDLTVLLVEHDMRLIMNLCERIVVLNYGKIIAQGNPAEVRADPQVIAAYLGVDDEANGA